MKRQSILASNGQTEAEPSAAWRPIESAPRDGTWIIVYLASWVTPPAKMTIVQWTSSSHGEGWHDTEYDDGPILSPVTHWCPLPSPPLSAQDTSERRS